MRYLFPVLFILLLFGSFTEQEKSLYLLYSKDNPKIKKFHLASDKYLTFTFKIEYQGEEYETIVFDESTKQSEKISMKELPSFQYKTINWLTKTYLEYFNYFSDEDAKVNEDGTLRVFNLNRMYDSIYIIIPNSCSGKAVIMQVKYNPAFSID